MKLRSQLALLIVACFSSLLSNAQKDLTIIRGHVEKENVKKLFLYQVIEGEMTEYATILPDAGKNYAFALANVKEGFYYIGDNLRSRNRFYLKAGESVTLDLKDDEYDISGKSAENKLMDEWEKLYSEIANPAFNFAKENSTYVTYFPVLKEFIPKAEAFKKKINTRNKNFNSLLTMVVDSDVEFAALQYLYTPRSAHPSKEEYPDYYKTIVKPGKFCDMRLLLLGDAISRMDRYTLYATLNSGVKLKPEEMMQRSVDAICNDTLKGVYVSSRLGRYKSLENLQADLSPYKKYFLTDSIKAKYLRAETALATYAQGEKAFNFAYPTVSGDTVSLTDLRGKVVFVDTWATWCGPCKVEIPHMKKLEEELKDKNIAFVSISVDEAKDHQKWMDFVKKENLGGIQLYAKGFSSEFAQYYKINAIPRFLIFDKDGKIVTVDSPRPSQPELKDLLLKLSAL